MATAVAQQPAATGDPMFRKSGDDYWVEWPDYMVRLRLSGVYEDKAGIHAEMVLYVDHEGAPSPAEWTQINLSSAQTRAQTANRLKESWAGPVPPPYRDMLNAAAVWAAEKFREGEPLLKIGGPRVVQAGRFALYPLLPERQTTIIYGDGASCKSLLCMAMAMSVQQGRGLLPGTRMGQVSQDGPSLYLDFETNQDEQHARIRRIMDGFGPQTGAIRQEFREMLYRECHHPLHKEAATIRRIVDDNRVGMVVVDSLGAAVGGDPNDAGEVIRTMNALRSFGVTVLAVDHVTKTDDQGKPFGCYSADTDLMTRSGWKRHDELQEGEEVAIFDPTTGRLRWSIPSKIHAYPYSGDMVSVQSHAVDLMVTPNHRMLVRPGWPTPDRSWRFKRADEIQKSDWLIPTAAAFEDGGRDVPEDFANFLGWFVTEGNIQANRGKWADRVYIGQNHGDLAERVWETADRLGFRRWRKSYQGEHQQPHWAMAFSGQPEIMPVLQQCGAGAANKRLPDCVWDWSPGSRTQLLYALWEGDGHWRRGGRSSGAFSTVSRQLADDVQRLAISVGWTANIRCRPVGYQVMVTPERSETYVRPERNFTTVPYDGMVYCLTVETGAYLVRRNGNAVICGNSAYKFNYSRAAWQAKRVQEQDSDRVQVALVHRKSNNGRIMSPMGFELAFDGDEGPIRFSQRDVRDVPELAATASVPSRIKHVLSSGPVRMDDIKSALSDVAAETLRKSMDRLRKAGEVVTLPDGRYGLGYKGS